jgi:RNA polymerase sigma factor FliA
VALETNVKAIELKDLWRRYRQAGDERARERLVVAYSPLVKYVAGRMASGLPAHVEEADLISYGLIGLISAIERFEIEREIKFETYAIPRIRGAIIDELRALDWVPRSVRARAREIKRANVKLENKLQRPPSDEEMAEELGIELEDFQEALIQISNSTIAALDELWTVSDTSGDQISLLDTLQDPGAPDPARVADAADLKDRVADAIARLPEREKLVIALYYYENLTLREIGEVLGVTESRVSQLHTKAILRLKAKLQGSLERASLERNR